MSFSNMANKNATTSLYMFYGVNAPSSFTLGRTISVVISLACAPIYCLFVVIVFKAFRKKAQNGKKNRSKRLILCLLLGNLLFSIFSALLSSIGFNMFGGLDSEICNYWARVGGFSYVMSNFFSYTILLMRAQAVGVVKGSGKTEKLLFKITLIAVKLGTVCVPLLASLCLVVFEGKTYFVEEYCVQAVLAWLAWLFMFLDTSLSSGYLMLFILPVMIHMRKMRTVTPLGVNIVNAAGSKSSKNRSGGDPIKATAIRNLKISSTAIASTCTYMLGVSMVSSFVSTEDEDLFPYLHFNTFQYYGSAIDTFINVICNMLMTKNLWASEVTSSSHRSKYTVGPATGTSVADTTAN